MSARPAVTPGRRARSGSKRGGAARVRSASPRNSLGREDWILAARTTLIRDGISAVNVLPLAGKLKVTRGGFYWHFRNRADLLDALLADWEANNTAAFEKVVAGGDHDGRAEFVAMVDVWGGTQSGRLPQTLCRPWAIGSSLLATTPSSESKAGVLPGNWRARAIISAPDR